MGSKNTRLVGHAVAAYYTAGASLTTSAAIESTVQAGEAQSETLKTQAKAEEFNAKNREIDRKRNLIRALSLQNVRGATSGVFGGVGSSQAAMMQEDIGRFELDQSTDVHSTTQRTSQLRANAKTARTSSLLSSASEAYKYKKRSDKRGTL